MRWLLTLLSAALLAAQDSRAAAAKKSSDERFHQFHGQALSASPVKLVDASYAELTASPRDYTAAVLLTALEARFGCQLCRDFQPEWDLLARSWTKGDKKGESRLVFGTIDFADGRNTFMALGLQTAPVLLLFPPTTGPHAAASPDAIRYDFTSGPPKAEQVHGWIARHMAGRPQPPVRRPFNWIGWITGLTIMAGSVTAAAVAWPYALPVVQNRNVWAAFSLVAILLFTSGHMFNQIRQVPYVAGNGRGGVRYFADGFQNQLGMETQIVAAMYGVLSFATISLAVKVPRISDPRVQGITLMVWAAVLFLMYSYMLSVFRMKNGGYPFSLPPFV